eukprot:1433673-Ditylum_brightwellii.AAC.1
MCVRLEKAGLQKPLKEKIACAEKEHDKDRKRKHQDKPKLCHKRRHGSGKCNKAKKNCDYHGLCYHGTDKCDFVQACRKHIRPTHCIMEQQRLRQVLFVKDAERRVKRRGLTGKEVKDFNTFVKDKIKETIKERDHNMHAMSNFKDLSISVRDKSIQSIVSNTSVDGLDDDSCKPAHKK